MGRFAANIIVFILNNEGYLIERALEANPDWSYNDLAPRRYAELPFALVCADWFTARVATLGALEAAMKTARDSKSGAYIEIIGGRLDMPPILTFAHGRLAVSSQTLMAHSYRVIRRMRYGTDSTRERHNDRGGPSSDTT
jgi:indolepyruvate decarboxylase